MHGGGQQKKSNVNNVIKVTHLPRFYSKVLTGTLNDFVQSCLDLPPHESLDLHEELALSRHSATHAVAMYNLACGVPVETPNRSEMIMNGISLMRESLSYVAEMCERCSRVEFAAKDKISVHQLQFVINQIVRIAHDALPEDQAKLFEELLREKIRIDTSEDAITGISTSGLGTMLLPGGELAEDIDVDQDVIDMDETVPQAV